MENPNKYFETLYKNFNERRINLAIDCMTDNVKWAMEWRAVMFMGMRV